MLGLKCLQTEKVRETNLRDVCTCIGKNDRRAAWMIFVKVRDTAEVSCPSWLTGPHWLTATQSRQLHQLFADLPLVPPSSHRSIPIPSSSSTGEEIDALVHLSIYNHPAVLTQVMLCHLLQREVRRRSSVICTYDRARLGDFGGPVELAL